MYNRILLGASSLLLLFNGIGALYGGWHLMTHPDGSSILLRLDYLKDSFFHNYFIPGIVLFCVNGLFNIVIIGAIIARNKHYPELIMAAGFLLLLWLITQIVTIQVLYFLQFILGGVGLGMIACGWLLRPFRQVHSAR